MRLSPRSQKLYDYIAEYIATNRYSPSYREICAALQFKSVSSVAYHMQKLKSEGLIETNGSTLQRAIVIAKPRNFGAAGHIEVPYVKNYTAGTDIYGEGNINGTYTFSSALIGTKRACFMMRITSDDMKDFGLTKGCFVVVEDKNTAEHNELVAVKLGGELVIRRCIKIRNNIILRAEKDSVVKDVPVDNIKVYGTLKLIIKQFEQQR